MDEEKLVTEVLRISQLTEYMRDPEIHNLWGKLKSMGYRKATVQKMVMDQVRAPMDAAAQDGLQTMLDEYFVIDMNGKVRFCHFISEQMNGHERRVIKMQTRADFMAWTEHRPEGKLWLTNPQRRMYDGLMTDPGKSEVWNNRLNLWCGFGIGPVVGDAKPFVDYVTIILGQNVPEWGEYILNWLAWVVQNPGGRIGVALCLISAKQGTGKGTLGNLLLTIFGQHGCGIYKSKGLTGDFNKHLADTLFAFADEALFAGDLRGADALKSIVTEPYLFIEPKGVDAVQMENRLSILMATNHRFAAQVEWSDRRFAMFEVNEEDQGRAYWNGLYGWIKGGGASIVLNYLLTRDVDVWHPVDCRPMTPIYLDARRQSLRETHRWWHEVLEAENLAAGTGTPAPVVTANGEIDKAVLYSTYKAWHRQNEHTASRPASAQLFWRDFWAMTRGAVSRYRPGKSPGEQTRVVVLPLVPSADAIPMPPGVPTQPINWSLLTKAFDDWLVQK